MTEYELDEARLKPGGVTVKCTNCGHMFKIRKRSNTNVGAAPVSERAPTQPRAQSVTGDPMAGDGERVWMIRLENGETRSCRELATLQQWIVAGVVTRESLISRSGKTWKRLGDIPELGQYFGIADEARGQRQRDGRALPLKPPSPAEMKGTLLGVGTPGSPNEAASNPALPVGHADTLLAKDAPPRSAAMQKAAMQKAAVAAGATVLPSAAPPPVPATPPRAARPTPPPPPPARMSLLDNPMERSTGAWAASEVRAMTDDAAPQGPSAGKVAAIPPEPAFAGRLRSMSADPGFGGEPVDDETGPVRVQGSGLGKWIAIGALVVIAAAFTVIYAVVLRRGDEKPAAAVVEDAAGSADLVAMADAAPPAPPDAAPPGVADVIQDARRHLYGDAASRLRDAAAGLAGLDESPEVLAMRARVATSLAQALDDEARFADKARADELRKGAREIVLEAVARAQRAVQAAPQLTMANAAMADLLRLQGKPAKEVRRYLDAVGPAGAGDREIVLVSAMLDLRDGQRAAAVAALAKLDAEPGKPGSMELTGDVRPRFQLALLAAADGKTADAKAKVESILVAQPDHVGARALADKLAGAVATTDPMPPEDPTPPRPGPGSGAGSAKTGTGPGPAPIGDDYDRVLKKANDLADNSCAQAMPFYEKALMLKPNSVEALTGVGYCHLDAKQFSSAYSKFRAALGISPRYERALWGIAEMYQQQGKKDEAVAAYRKYLDAYPDSAAAKKQIERLGGDGGAPPPPTPPAEGGGTPPPADKPADP